MSLPNFFFEKEKSLPPPPPSQTNNKSPPMPTKTTKQTKITHVTMKFVSLQLMVPILSTQNPAFAECRKECHALVIIYNLPWWFFSLHCYALDLAHMQTNTQRFKPGILAQLQSTLEHARQGKCRYKNNLTCLSHN